MANSTLDEEKTKRLILFSIEIINTKANCKHEAFGEMITHNLMKIYEYLPFLYAIHNKSESQFQFSHFNKLKQFTILIKGGH